MIVRELINMIRFLVDPTSVNNAKKQTDKLIDDLGTFSKQGLMFVTAPFIGFSILAAKLYSEQKTLLDQITTTLNNTQNAVGLGLEELTAQAKELQTITAVEDKRILSEVTLNLLKFSSIHDEYFIRAQKSILDMSAAMDPSLNNLQENAKKVGKGLASPLDAINELKEAGILFSKAQIAMIENFVAMNDLASAQDIILTELEKKYKGSAEQAAKNAMGFGALKNSAMDLVEAFGKELLPFVQAITRGLTALIQKINVELSPTLRQSILLFWGLAAALPIVAAALFVLLKTGAMAIAMFTALKTAAAAANLSVLALLTKFLLWGIIVAAIFATVFLLFDDFYTYLKGGESFLGRFLEPWKTLGAKIKEYFKPFLYILEDLWKEVKSFFINAFEFISNIFKSNSDAAAVNLADMIKNLFNILVDLFALLIPLLWDLLKVIIFDLIPAILKALDQLLHTIGDALAKLLDEYVLTPIIDFVRDIWKTISDYCSNMFADLGDMIINWVNKIIGYLNKIPGVNITPIGAVDREKSYFEMQDDLMNKNLPPGLQPGWYKRKQLGQIFQSGILGATNSLTENKNLNITIDIPLNVPQGTTGEQIQYIGTAADEIFQKHLNNLGNQLRYSPGVAQ